MRIEQRCWTAGDWGSPAESELNGAADLVLAFGPAAALRDGRAFARLHERYPAARVIGCTAGGEIRGAKIDDDRLAVTAIHFQHTIVKPAQVEVANAAESYVAGQRLAEALWSEELVHVLLLADGSGVNGGELTRGLSHALPDGVSITGGLCAPAAEPGDSFVFLDEPGGSNCVAAIGFYGKRLKVACGSGGGFEPFGPERIVTAAGGHVLRELDGKPALDAYEQDLGAHAAGLPAAALLFPLSFRTNDPTQGVVRTVLHLDEAHRTITLAGDVTEGSYARLMRATSQGLVRGAGLAADNCCCAGELPPQLALLVSCVNRRRVLQQRTCEEIEAVRDVFGPGAALAGFYAGGEISPHQPGERPELHNQTMAVAAFSEN